MQLFSYQGPHGELSSIVLEKGVHEDQIKKKTLSVCCAILKFFYAFMQLGRSPLRNAEHMDSSLPTLLETAYIFSHPMISDKVLHFNVLEYRSRRISLREPLIWKLALQINMVVPDACVFVKQLLARSGK